MGDPVMAGGFVELIVSGTTELVRGFVAGFHHRGGRDFAYFFHHRSAIRHDTVSEFVKELLELENRVDLCVEERIAPELIAAIRGAAGEIEISLAGSRRIQEARLLFSFSMYDEARASELKVILAHPPPGVAFADLEPKEERHPEAAKERSMGYAPLHPYSFTGRGTARGGVQEILGIRDRFRQLSGDGLIEFGDIELVYRSDGVDKR
jgi:hypothetical protein